MCPARVPGSPDEGYEATVVQKVGPVKATFKGQVTITDLVPAQSMTISGEGKGGAAGFAKGEAKVTFTEADGATEVGYDVEAKVGGKLAQLGSRIIDGQEDGRPVLFEPAGSPRGAAPGRRQRGGRGEAELVQAADRPELTRALTAGSCASAQVAMSAPASDIRRNRALCPHATDGGDTCQPL